MSERSHWGWGEAGRLPDRDAREALAAQVAAVLGVEPGAPREAVPLDAVELAPPRVQAPDALAAIASAHPHDRARHAHGRGFCDQVRGFGGDFTTAPDLVLRPRSDQEVTAILDWASGARVAVVPFGGGTSVVGGVSFGGDGFAGVASLDTEALSGVREVDVVGRSARIGAGMKGPALEAALAPHGLTLRHYPQSFEFSTLGGWIATRAGGHFATLYTHIDDLVASARMITPRGAWESLRLPGSGAGPSPDRMVLGSEGALGVITEAWMRLQRRPRYRSSAALHYERFEDAVAATREVAQAGLYPANCRLLDAREAMLNGVAMGKAVLLLGFESAHHPVDRWLQLAIEAAQAHGGELPEPPRHRDDAGRTSEEGDAGRWRKAFFEGPYLQSALLSMGMVVDTFETACTWDRFGALHADVVRSVKDAMKQACGTGLLTCRFTHVYPDGPAPYYTFIAPGRHDGQIEQWTAVKRAAADALARNRATITHHHAVGRLHRPWYDRQRPEPFAAVLKAAKGAVDPSGVLNPGVLLGPVCGSWSLFGT